MKKCYKCLVEKDESEFSKDKTHISGLDDWCKKCKSEKRKIYYAKNKEKEHKKTKLYNKINKEKIREQRKKHYRQNIDRLRKVSNEYYHKNQKMVMDKHTIWCRKRHRSDIVYKMRCNVSTVIGYYLKKSGNTKRKRSIMEFLPYTMEELKKHLESQFESWMNWENYGVYEKNRQKWCVDHIIPQSLLPYDSLEHPNFQKCWALENLRPLEIIKNIKKGNKIIDIEEISNDTII